MSNDLLGHPVARAMLVSPPDWLRVARFVATAWLLALGGIWAAQQLHAASHEALALSPAVHLLRDTALAVPLAALAMAVAGLLATELTHATGLEPSSAASRVAWAVIAACVFAVLSIPGQEAHGLLFGAEPETGDWLTDVILDSGAVLVASLVVLVPTALLRIAPWPPHDVHAPEAGRQPAAPGTTNHPPVTAIDRLGEQGVSRHA